MQRLSRDATTMHREHTAVAACTRQSMPDAPDDGRALPEYDCRIAGEQRRNHGARRADASCAAALASPASISCRTISGSHRRDAAFDVLLFHRPDRHRQRSGQSGLAPYLRRDACTEDGTADVRTVRAQLEQPLPRHHHTTSSTFIRCGASTDLRRRQRRRYPRPGYHQRGAQQSLRYAATTPSMQPAAARMPAADLDLSDGPSEEEADQKRAYRELLFADRGPDHRCQRRTWSTTASGPQIDPVTNVAVCVAFRNVPAPLNVGNPRASRFFQVFDAGSAYRGSSRLHESGGAQIDRRMAQRRRAVLQRSVRRSGELMLRLLRLLALAGLFFAAVAQADEPEAEDSGCRSVHRTAHGAGPRLTRCSMSSSAAARSRSSSGAPTGSRCAPTQDVEGWVPRAADGRDAGPDWRAASICTNRARENYMSRRWQGGVMAGDFDGASLISAFGGYCFQRQPLDRAHLSITSSASSPTASAPRSA